MSKGGCRDCNVCTRSCLETWIYNLMNLVLFVCTLGIVPLMRSLKNAGGRRCPQCGHLLSAHARRADGSFKD